MQLTATIRTPALAIVGLSAQRFPIECALERRSIYWQGRRFGFHLYLERPRRNEPRAWMVRYRRAVEFRFGWLTGTVAV